MPGAWANRRIMTRGRVYVVLRVNERKLDVEFIRVTYEVEKAAQAIEATDMPDEFAAMLRSATG